MPSLCHTTCSFLNVTWNATQYQRSTEIIIPVLLDYWKTFFSWKINLPTKAPSCAAVLLILFTTSGLAPASSSKRTVSVEPEIHKNKSDDEEYYTTLTRCEHSGTSYTSIWEIRQLLNELSNLICMGNTNI